MSLPSKTFDSCSVLGRVKITAHAQQRMLQRIGSVNEGVSMLTSATKVIKGKRLARYISLGHTEETYGILNGRYLFIVCRGKLQAPQYGSMNGLYVKSVICVPLK